MLIVYGFAGVLFQMEALNSDAFHLPVREVNLDLAFADDRRFVLGNLIAERQVGIEIILSCED